MLDAQHRVLDHLAPRLAVVPRLVRTTTGSPFADVRGPAGVPHRIWAVTFMPMGVGGDSTLEPNALFLERGLPKLQIVQWVPSSEKSVAAFLRLR